MRTGIYIEAFEYQDIGCNFDKLDFVVLSYEYISCKVTKLYRPYVTLLPLAQVPDSKYFGAKLSSNARFFRASRFCELRYAKEIEQLAVWKIVPFLQKHSKDCFEICVNFVSIFEEYLSDKKRICSSTQS